MFRLIGRIFWAIVFMAIGAAAWNWRDVWMPRARQVISATLPDGAAPGWAVITAEGAQRTLTRAQRLSSSTGPAYVNVAAADFAAYALGSALVQIAETDSTPEALAEDGKLWLRADVRLADLGGREALGPLAAMFNDAEPVLIAGRLEAVRPGLAQFRITDAALKELKVPSAALSRLVSRWGPADRPDGVSPDALPVQLPSYVADLRVTNGRVTLYKTVE
jgi:hypothetical protein